MTNKSSLFINGLELELFLGWPNEERMRKQIVTLDLDIVYPATPAACTSDDLKGTVCYRELIEKLRAHIGERKFHLIEHVTQEVYDTLKTELPKGTRLKKVSSDDIWIKIDWKNKDLYIKQDQVWKL